VSGTKRHLCLGSGKGFPENPNSPDDNYDTAEAIDLIHEVFPRSTVEITQRPTGVPVGWITGCRRRSLANFVTRQSREGNSRPKSRNSSRNIRRTAMRAVLRKERGYDPVVAAA